jgi:hypothetical protein
MLFSFFSLATSNLFDHRLCGRRRGSSFSGIAEQQALRACGFRKNNTIMSDQNVFIAKCYLASMLSSASILAIFLVSPLPVQAGFSPRKANQCSEAINNVSVDIQRRLGVNLDRIGWEGPSKSDLYFFLRWSGPQQSDSRAVSSLLNSPALLKAYAEHLLSPCGADAIVFNEQALDGRSVSFGKYSDGFVRSCWTYSFKKKELIPPCPGPERPRY